MPVVLIDSTTLGVLTNPANKIEPLQCTKWVQLLTKSGILIAVPAVIDYENRRKLIHLGNQEALERLEALGEYVAYLPTSQEDWHKAAELWAWAKKTNQQTASQDRIDIDVILAAQAVVLAQELGEHVVIATDNLNHILRYNVPARPWREITLEYCQNPKTTQPPALSKAES